MGESDGDGGRGVMQSAVIAVVVAVGSHGGRIWVDELLVISSQRDGGTI